MSNKTILKFSAALIMVSALSGCIESDQSDLKSWMQTSENGMKGKIDPLPAPKTYVSVGYNAKLNPFVQREIISLAEIEKTKYAPDFSRKKEPLEDYPLESLTLVGTLYKDKIFYAMIKGKDGSINYVTKGNYLGSNYGRVIELEESQIVLDERVKDSSEAWKESRTVVPLTEDDNRGKSKK